MLCPQIRTRSYNYLYYLYLYDFVSVFVCICICICMCLIHHIFAFFSGICSTDEIEWNRNGDGVIDFYPLHFLFPASKNCVCIFVFLFVFLYFCLYFCICIFVFEFSYLYFFIVIGSLTFILLTFSFLQVGFLSLKYTTGNNPKKEEVKIGNQS